MEIIKREWSESELLDKLVKENQRKDFLKKSGKSSKEVDLRISSWNERLEKLRK